VVQVVEADDVDAPEADALIANEEVPVADDHGTAGTGGSYVQRGDV
jgi:hypothetical protein